MTTKKSKKTKTTSRPKKEVRGTDDIQAKEKTKLVSTDHRDDGNRIPINLLVDYNNDGHYLFDFCKDLGTGGIFIETSSPLDQGTSLDLTFTIPDSKETLSTKGKVIWVQKPVTGRKDLTPGMGVQFVGFDGSQRSLLENFLNRFHGDRHTLTPTQHSA
jgi:type IV pilus assembly protein PilZ